MEQLEVVLMRAFNDYRLSKTEHANLNECLMAYRDDAQLLQCLQEKSFLMVNEYLQKQPAFDSHAFGWLEHILAAIEAVKTPAISAIKSNSSNVIFNNDQDCEKALIKHVAQAQKSIDICVAAISLPKLVKALILAQKRNVRFRIITHSLDDSAENLTDGLTSSKIELQCIHKQRSFKLSGAPFALIDNELLLTGTFNWCVLNEENMQQELLIIKGEEVVDQFSQRFRQAWKM